MKGSPGGAPHDAAQRLPDRWAGNAALGARPDISHQWPLDVVATGRSTSSTCSFPGQSPEYACSPLNHSEPEYVTSTIANPTTSRSAAGRPAHERWFRAWRYTAY